MSLPLCAVCLLCLQLLCVYKLSVRTAAVHRDGTLRNLDYFTINGKSFSSTKHDDEEESFGMWHYY